MVRHLAVDLPCLVNSSHLGHLAGVFLPCENWVKPQSQKQICMLKVHIYNLLLPKHCNNNIKSELTHRYKNYLPEEHYLQGFILNVTHNQYTIPNSPINM